MLSRAFLKETGQEVDMTPVIHSIKEYLPIPADEIKMLQDETERDINLRAVLDFVRKGWRKIERKLLPVEQKIYFDLRDELFEKEGIIFYNDKIVVPKMLRRHMMDYIHGLAHLGINKTVARMRKIMYWPGLAQDVAEFIGFCSVCQTYQDNPPKEPLIATEIPSLPFTQVGMDIGEYKGFTFLVIEDYYSRWLEIIPLKSKAAKEIIKKLAAVFINHGVPKIIRCDNNPFKSEEMQAFAKKWKTTIKTASPLYPKSNGLSEKGVGIAKKLIKKCWHSKSDLDQALLEYRVTPITGLQYSPSELLMGRILRTTAPVTTEILKPKLLEEGTRNRMEKLKQKQKKNYDAHAREKPEFSPDQWVYMRWGDKWKEAKISDKLAEPRSYLVAADGKEYRRNSSFLRPRKSQADSWKSRHSQGMSKDDAQGEASQDLKEEGPSGTPKSPEKPKSPAKPDSPRISTWTASPIKALPHTKVLEKLIENGPE
ncbi:unnamed protein product, partial [Nesidiocoris tenuis]